VTPGSYYAKLQSEKKIIMRRVIQFPYSLIEMWVWGSILLVAGLLMSPTAAAQSPSPDWAFDAKTLFIGELQNFYHAGGAKVHVGGCHGLASPGWWRRTCNTPGNGLNLGTKNFTDDNGRDWDHMVSHIGYRANGVGEMFPQKLEMISRFEPPEVFVDGMKTFTYPIFYERVDPDMAADAMVENVVNSEIGLTMTRKVYAFSNEYHDNYHIIEMEFENTGQINEERSLSEQTLEGVYVNIITNYRTNEQASGMAGHGGGWGRNNMIDEIGEDDDLSDYDIDFRAQFGWLGREPTFTEWNTIGGPALSDANYWVFEGDSVGRLMAPYFVGHHTMYAEGSPDSEVDDPNQPSVMGWADNGANEWSADPDNPEQNALEYAMMEGKANLGSWADQVVGPPANTPESPEAWYERMARQTRDPGETIHGKIHYTVYGPYDLAPGETFKLVYVEGTAGLSKKAAREIGKQYKKIITSGQDEFTPISYDANGDGQIGPGETMSKNEWVMTSRDSLLQMFGMAQANYESGFAIPRAPQPPKVFRVFSRPNRIELEWEPYAGANPSGYELYRTSRRREGDYSGYDLIAGVDELGPDATSYSDTGVQRGIDYFYYIQAVSQEETTREDEERFGIPAGERLRSGRAYTQTYDPAAMTRSPGETLQAVRVVPNPYNLGSSSTVRWPDRQDKIGFLDIPGQATIRIYTEVGELVETIEHTDGSGDAYWDLTTSSNQLVVSGIYMAVIEDNNTGDQIIRKFSVLR
jgi:hypothetical protein